MEELVQKSTRLVALAPSEPKRRPPAKLDWNWKLNALLGARGTGKTTMLLQRIATLNSLGAKALYVTLDDLYFTEHRLLDVATQYAQLGGEYLFVDEVHKYPGWARELKNIYDSIPELRVVFSGSSILEIFRQDVDLSRRALVYELPGLSFREYLSFTGTGNFDPVDLQDMVSHHSEIALELIQHMKPIPHFQSYLRSGYYPFFMETHRDYQLTLEQIVTLVIENDLQYVDGFDVSYSRKVMQLLKIIAGSPPFKPNITKLSERIGINRNTLVGYFRFLERARLVSLATYPDSHISALQKPDKVFLQNPNLYFALEPLGADIGSIRESFFFSQLHVVSEIHLDKDLDFIVTHGRKKYEFEIGGANKTRRQLRSTPGAYLVRDDIENGAEKQIPLWLFGFLY